MSQAAPDPDGTRVESELVLTDEHLMLLNVRDTLYEGSWEDFKRDLEARHRAQPHVFDTVPDSPHMLETIRNHLELIRQMWEWEVSKGIRLHGGADAE